MYTYETIYPQKGTGYEIVRFGKAKVNFLFLIFNGHDCRKPHGVKYHIYSHFKVSAGEVLQILRPLKSTITNVSSKARAVTTTNNNVLI